MNGIPELTVPSSLGSHIFLHKITTSGVKIRPVLNKFMIFISVENVKLLLYFKGSQAILLVFFFGSSQFNRGNQIL